MGLGLGNCYCQDLSFYNCYGIENPYIADNPFAPTDHFEESYVESLHSTNAGRMNDVYTIPIVVHVVHDNGTENIPDDQILNGIAHINDAFRNLGDFASPDNNDSKIQFCLAQRDTLQELFSGIRRIESNSTVMNSSSAFQEVVSNTAFDQEKYLNIRIVSDVCFGVDCATAGFAIGGNYKSTGIYIEAQYFGTSKQNSAYIVHELGHFLGLFHTFQGGCPNSNCLTSGDRVCDTPSDQNVSSIPCNHSINSCRTDEEDSSINNPFRPSSLGGLGDQHDLNNNFMDYIFDPYRSAFTEGQVERMRYYLEQKLSSLLSSLACFPPCDNEVQALISIGPDSIQIGQNITLTSESLNAQFHEWYIDEDFSKYIKFLRLYILQRRGL